MIDTTNSSLLELYRSLSAHVDKLTVAISHAVELAIDVTGVKTSFLNVRTTLSPYDEEPETLAVSIEYDKCGDQCSTYTTWLLDRVRDDGDDIDR